MTSDVDDRDEAMTSGLLMAERQLLHRELRVLPDTAPPHEVWLRIERQARAEGLFRDTAPTTRAKWLAGALVAASVALAVLGLPPFGEMNQEDVTFPTEPAFTASESVRNLDALMVQSQLLERDLRALPPQTGVIRVGTAATISDLEDRIAAIDYALSEPGATLSSADAELFWRERVRLMDSLVQVRYAQARRASF